MRAKVTADFHDLSAGVVRKAGETFECTQERFDRIKAVLPEHIAKAEPARRAPRKAE